MVWSAIGAVLVMTLVVPALSLPASASSAPLGATTALSAPQQWAYGAQKWVNVSITLPNATYVEHAFFGWQVIYTMTNTSNTSYQLEAQRTMGAYFYADYCRPNCSAPTVHGNVSLQGWESDVGFANLTTTANVTENGSAVPALGLVNASAQSSAHLAESFVVSGTGPQGHSVSASGTLTVNGAAHMAVDFTPPLGLVPMNLTNGTHWNSTSAFTAQGGYSLAFNWTRTAITGATSSGNGSQSGSANANGTVAIHGADLGTVRLANGQTVPVIVLVTVGPFNALDGFVLLPGGYNLFGQGHHDWDGESAGLETVATGRLDVHLDAREHRLHVDAATSSYATDASGVTDVAPSSGVAAATPMAGPTGSSPTDVQAQPESVATAQQNAACLTGTCASSGSQRAMGALVIGLLIASAIAVVVGTVAVVEYRRWAARRRPPAGPPAIPAGPMWSSGIANPPPSEGPTPPPE